MKLKSQFTIDTAKKEDIATLLSFAKAEGWNPGLDDASPFFSCDPGGFFVAKLDDEIIGCISAVRYGPQYGFMGFYIVLAPYRGKGYGLKLWNKAIEYMGDRAIGLDGVVAQQDNYKKSGFELAHRNFRFEAVSLPHQTLPAEILELKRLPFDEILKYDTRIFGVERKAFLSEWVTLPHGVALGYLGQGNVLKGYGVLRKCHHGYKIGPLFADNRTIAEQLLDTFRSRAEEGPVYFDVPATNPEAMTMARDRKMTLSFETARMYRGKPPRQPIDKIYGITTFELG